MFDAHCPGHRSRVLLPAGHVLRVVPGTDHTTVYLRCWCGSVATFRAAKQARGRTGAPGVAA
jgi:hypothetical protein